MNSNASRLPDCITAQQSTAVACSKWADSESCARLLMEDADILQVLLDKGVDEGKILFLSLIAAPEGIHKICGIYPRVKVVTSEIDEAIAPDFQVIPGVGEFGDRYFCD